MVEKRPVTNSPNIRIADFGVSCYEKDLAVEASVGEQRTVGKVGTACFRAPEVVSFYLVLNNRSRQLIYSWAFFYRLS